MTNELKQPLLPPRPPPALSPALASSSSSSLSNGFLPGRAVSSFNIDGLGVGKKKRPQGLRSWIEVNSHGEVKYLEMDKGSIMRRCDLPGRDLRLLDPVFVYPSTILGREKAIVVNLESIRCIISAEEVLLLNAAGSEAAVQQYMQTLQQRVRVGLQTSWRREMGADETLIHSGSVVQEDDLPFEFKALELALEFACARLDAQFNELSQEAYPVLEKLAFTVNTSNLELVRRIKSSLLTLTRRVQKVRDEIEQLMDDDGDMAEMYLTEKKMRAEASGSDAPLEDSVSHGGAFAQTLSASVGGSLSAPVSPSGSPTKSTFAFDTREKHAAARGSVAGGSVWSSHRGSSTSSSAVDDVETLEMILEAYFVVIDGTLSKLSQLSQYIDDTEDFINIQLDNVRNQLIQFELLMTTAAFVVALWGVVMGLFGMNVPLGVEDDPYALKWILVWTALGGVIMFVGFLAYFKYRKWTLT